MTESQASIYQRLRRLVDEEVALEQWRARWARRLVLLFALPIALFLFYLISHA